MPFPSGAERTAARLTDDSIGPGGEIDDPNALVIDSAGEFVDEDDAR